MDIRTVISRFAGSLKGDALYLYTSRTGAVLLQSISLFVVAAEIGVEEFGRFTFIFSASQIVAVIVNAGSQEYLQRVLPSREVRYGGAGNTNIVLACFFRGILLSGSLFALISIIYLCGIKLPGANWFQAPLIIATGFLLSCLYILVAVVRVAKSAGYSMLLRDLFPYLFFLAGFYTVYVAGHTSAEAVIGIFCGSLIAVILLSAVSGWRYLKAHKIDNSEYDTDGNRYSVFWGSSIAGASFSQADIIIARLFLNDEGLGIYSIARRVSNLVSMPQIIANWTINVSVAKNFELNDFKALQQQATRGLIISAPLAIFGALTIIASSGLWLPLFHVTPSIQVILLLAILIFAQLVNVLAGANLLFAAQCRQEVYAFRVRLASLALGIASMTGGAALFGAPGIALGVLVSIIYLNGMVTRHVKRTTGVITSISTKLFQRK